MPIEIKLLVQPLTVNQAFTGRHFKTPAYRIFQHDVLSLLPVAKQTLDGPCVISYEFGLLPLQYKTCDVDNMLKTITDLVAKRGYIKNDNKIIELHAKKVLSAEFYIKVCISPLA